tara:strand:+ start:159216 stop:159440 length:225 start_codon:yes stop_codon:yes gene_type:complete
MNDKKPEEGQIKDAVIDHLQEVVNQAKAKLELINCPEHGKALQNLELIRDAGRFDIKCCCDAGEKLVEEAIANL